ncbi:hypothetical protein C2845_PM09G08640 [Panicum miliaceum]|uniref:mTERF domain-containing protein 1, mitochondrial n=1 Tax=Panicum miliaceum TaxID=4540 RepID=A0A3L6S1H0_PANMI|nr:hypothetical protein C2845_PM09G08640 [Panicum miliaceum]
MLHLQKYLGISFRHQWLFSVTRFATIAASAPSADPAPFAVEDYLVASCHLTRNKARKASKAKALSHLKSPSNPDAVLAFLSGLGLPPPRHRRRRRPRPGTPLQAPTRFRHPDIVSKLQYYIPFFGSFHDFIRALKKSSYHLLCVDLESVVKPNVSCLRECWLSAHEISKTCILQPRLLFSKQENVRAMLARAEDIGIPRRNPVFRHALQFVAGRNKEMISRKMELLKTFRWSDALVASVVSRNPSALTVSEDTAQRVSEFLISEVGLDPEYIARRPSLIKYSLEGRLMPRHYVVKFLKVNGLLGHDRDYYTAVKWTDKVFVEKFINPNREAAPHLAEDYTDACRGKMPSRFRLQEPGTGLASV